MKTVDDINAIDEDNMEPVSSTKRLYFDRHLTNTFKARLFQDQHGQFWVPMDMIVNYTNKYIDVWAKFEQTYINQPRFRNSVSPIDEE